MQTLRVPPKDIDRTLPIPLQEPKKGNHRGWGATTAGGRWWGTAGSQPLRQQQKPAWSKATKKGDGWRLDSSLGTGCMSYAEGRVNAWGSP